MKLRRLYTNQKPNDFSVKRLLQVFFDSRDTSYMEYSRVVKFLRTQTTGTVGYSYLIETGYPPLHSMYLFFNDDNDCLMFKLWSKFDMPEMQIWPSSLRFTVYEHVVDAISSS